MGFIKEYIFGIEERAEPTTESTTKSEEEKNLDISLKGADVINRVTRKQALTIPSVASGINLIAGTIAGLPIKFYKKSNGKVEEVKDDARTKLLNIETEGVLSPYEVKNAMIRDYLLEGECYCYVGKTGNTPINIQYVPQGKVALLDNQKTIDRDISYYIDGKKHEVFNMIRAIRNSEDGARGNGILVDNSMLLSTMFNALEYENGSMSKGGKKGFLKSEGRLNKDVLDALKSAWKKLYSNNDSDVIVLNKGLSFESAESTATENQLNENKETNANMMYKVFGFTEDMFKSDDAFRIFIKNAIVPVVNCISNAINRTMLLESEKGTYYFSFDLNNLQRSDMLARYQAYQVALNSHWIGIDEVRKLEELSPLEIEFVNLGLGDILYYPNSKTIYTPNTGEFKSLAMKGGEKIED